MNTDKPGANRSISPAQFASSDAGATSRLGRRLPAFLCVLLLEYQQERKHLHGLAQSHVVGEACAESQPMKEIEPADAGLLVGSERRAERRTRVHARQSLRTAQAPQRLREPGARDDG